MDAALTTRLIDNCHSEVERYEQKTHPVDFPPLPPIPTARYLDPELFELERQRLWSKTWLYAGFANELPQAGSFKLWENAGISVILVRGRDLRVRAFYNTCRHRGGALVREECGKSRMLVCKFHAWTYDLEGALKHVPGAHDFPGLDKATHGLVPLRCEQWGNMIFVNRDQYAAPLLDWLGPLVDDFADLSMDTRTAFDVRTYEMPCNWKIAIDAFVESYHLAQVHPQTVSNYVDHRGSHIDLYDNGHSTMYTLQKTGEDAAEYSPLGTEGSDEHRIGRETIRGYTVFPNIQCSASEHEFAFLMFWPVDIRTTRIEAVYSGPQGHNDPDSIAAKQLTTIYELTLDEDLANLSWLQKSIESGANDAMPISYIERRIYHHAEAVDRVIGVENIPERLRIPHLLEPFHVNPHTS